VDCNDELRLVPSYESDPTRSGCFDRAFVFLHFSESVCYTKLMSAFLQQRFLLIGRIAYEIKLVSKTFMKPAYQDVQQAEIPLFVLDYTVKKQINEKYHFKR